MGELTKIQWAHHTFNPWRGCDKVSEGCRHCYAEALAQRQPDVFGIWGPKGTRVVASESSWRQPLAWDRAAARDGVRRRVFCGSMCDVFEVPEGPSFVAAQEARKRLFGCFEDASAGLIESTPNLDWMLLTKRPENIARIFGQLGIPGWWEWMAKSSNNVWLGTSVEDQATADQRIPHLLQVPARVRFLSCEPLLSQINLGARSLIHWLIAGGESGPHARPCDVAWVRDLVWQCRDAGVACFVKQLGARPVMDYYHDDPDWREWGLEHEGRILAPSGCEWVEHRPRWDGQPPPGSRLEIRLRDRKGGSMEEWPEDLRVRQFPEVQP